MEQTTIQSVTEVITTGHIVTAILILVLVWLALKALQLVAVLLANKFSRYRIQITGIVPLVRIIIWAITLYIVIVNVFNPPQATLVAMLASTGLAVGLAAQDMIRNIISGTLILFEQPFRVGDMVKVDGHYGEVKSNANAGAINEMVVIPFVMPANVDVKAIKALALEAAACSPYAYLRKPINVVVSDEFNRTFLTKFVIKAYVLDVRFERKFSSDVIERLKQALLQRGLITPELITSVNIENSGHPYTIAPTGSEHSQN